MSICIINFSGRSNGNCHDIATVIAESVSAGHEAALLEMPHLIISPCGNCGYDCFRTATSCPFIEDDAKRLYDSICSSDMAYFIVPNYCDYPNAHFFAFNERGQCYFRKNEALLEKYLSVPKRFVVVSNTGKENFQKAFQYHVRENDGISGLFLAARSFDRSSIDGGLMESAEARRLVVDFALCRAPL